MLCEENILSVRYPDNDDSGRKRIISYLKNLRKNSQRIDYLVFFSIINSKGNFNKIINFFKNFYSILNNQSL